MAKPSAIPRVNHPMPCERAFEWRNREYAFQCIDRCWFVSDVTLPSHRGKHRRAQAENSCHYLEERVTRQRVCFIPRSGWLNAIYSNSCASRAIASRDSSLGLKIVHTLHTMYSLVPKGCPESWDFCLTWSRYSPRTTGSALCRKSWLCAGWKHGGATNRSLRQVCKGLQPYSFAVWRKPGPTYIVAQPRKIIYL